MNVEKFDDRNCVTLANCTFFNRHHMIEKLVSFLSIVDSRPKFTISVNSRMQLALAVSDSLPRDNLSLLLCIPLAGL